MKDNETAVLRKLTEDSAMQLLEGVTLPPDHKRLRGGEFVTITYALPVQSNERSAVYVKFDHSAWSELLHQLDVAKDFKDNPKKVSDVIYSFFTSKGYSMSETTFAAALGRVGAVGTNLEGDHVRRRALRHDVRRQLALEHGANEDKGSATAAVTVALDRRDVGDERTVQASRQLRREVARLVRMRQDDVRWIQLAEQSQARFCHSATKLDTPTLGKLSLKMGQCNSMILRR